MPAGFDAFDQLATMVALADPDGHCLYANSALENTLGVSRRALQRGSVLEWLADAAQLGDTLRLVARNEIATSRFDAAMRRAGGSELPVHVIVSQTDWPQRVHDALGERQISVVLDGVGGELGRTAFDLLGVGGRLILFGWSAGTPTSITTLDLVPRGLTVTWALPRLLRQPGGLRQLETQALAAAAAGEIVPLVQTFPLAQAAVAHTALETRATTGKVVLVP